MRQFLLRHGGTYLMSIHSSSEDGELMLTILASYAQEESRSVSENCKWRIRKQFEVGKLATLRFMYGYRIQRGQIEIQENEAEVVRGIFRDYVSGVGCADIARTLCDQLSPTLRGGEWTPNRVRKILLNEKYTGNAVLQKTYVVDHLSKKVATNRGERSFYDAVGSHPAIIDVETYERAQAILARNGEQFKPGQTPHIAHPFTRLIACGHCGKHYTRKYNNGQFIWHCHTYMMFGKNACAARAVPEAVLEAIVNEALGPNGLALVERIIVPEQYRLIFELRDGRCIEKTWEPRSRSESWDEAARERAREHARKRWSK